jgi:glycosyltransferase involved in cell wall biosynthesis
MKVCRVTTVPEAFVHFKDVLKVLSAKGIDIHLVSSEGKYWAVVESEVAVKKSIISISREISPINDLISIYKLYQFYKKERFDIVHSSTPKAGLVSAIAAFLARVPVRIHTFTGQRWETITGFKRGLLIFLDKIIARLNTWCYTDSPSQTEYLQNLKILNPNSSSCLGSGSFGGIDPKKFLTRNSSVIREHLGIDDDAFVASFVGRITKDKGIIELVTSFKALRAVVPRAHLILIGSFEEKLDPLPSEIVSEIKKGKNIHFVGFQNHPEDYLALSDVMCLPSYREGFGTVVLESAILGIPCIGSNITGLKDAIKDGETGLLFTLKKTEELSAHLIHLANNPDHLKKLGLRAKERVSKDFHFEHLANLLYADYQHFLSGENR